ncbi:MAG: ribonuclease III [Bacteroidota bacterium]
MKNRGFYVDLVRMLGFFPRRISYYKLAFLPKSALQKHPSGVRLNNERLEYLGDAVLDAIVADYLYTRFPEGDEGFMTKLRARIVKRKTLNYLAAKMEIPGMVSQAGNSVNKSKHLYGNALEALIGAIYIDRGYKAAKKFFIRKIMKKHIDLVQLVKKDPDYKSRVIEWAQKNRMEIVFESQEEHLTGVKSPSFVSSISLKGFPAFTGRGASKKEAEQQAAKKALEHIHTL